MPLVSIILASLLFILRQGGSQTSELQLAHIARQLVAFADLR